MPSTSVRQQKAMAIALAAKRGETPVSKLKGSSLSMYKSMSEEQLKDFASTGLSGLPYRKRSSKGHNKYKVLGR